MSYNEEQIAHGLDMLRFYKGNLLQASKVTGIARGTLRKWQSGNLPKSANVRKVDRDLENGVSAQLAQKAEEVALKALDAAPERIEKAGFRDLLVGAEVAIRSAQLLRGRPTTRTEGIKISLVVPGGLRQVAAHTIDGEFKVLPERTEDAQPDPAA